MKGFDWTDRNGLTHPFFDEDGLRLVVPDLTPFWPIHPNRGMSDLSANIRIVLEQGLQSR